MFSGFRSVYVCWFQQKFRICLKRVCWTASGPRGDRTRDFAHPLRSIRYRYALPPLRLLRRSRSLASPRLQRLHNSRSSALSRTYVLHCMCLGLAGNGSVRSPVPPRRVRRACKAPYRPASRRLVLRAVVEPVAPAASVGATKEHSAGPAASRALKPAPTTAKAGPCLGKGHDLPHVLPLVTPCTVAVDEVDAVGFGYDADRACRLAAVGPLD